MTSCSKRAIIIGLALALTGPWISLANIHNAEAQEWTHKPPVPALKGPWSDKSLSPDRRADLLIEQMTLDEKITLVHGDTGEEALQNSLGGRGFFAGIPRLGIPALQMTDGRSGVANIEYTG